MTTVSLQSWALVGVLAFPLAGESASFDCAKARTQVEKLICADEELSHLDEVLKQAYETAKDAAASTAFVLQRDQQRWLALRNGCQARRCIKTAYKARLEELRKSTDAKTLENEKWRKAAETMYRTQMAPVLAFLERGGDPNARTQDSSLLQTATNWNDRDAVKALLEKGADPNQCGASSSCPLFISTGRDTEILRMLVAAGANVNHTVEKLGYTALSSAAGSQRKTFLSLQATGGYRGAFPDPNESVRILIAAGADVNHIDSSAYSPLRIAMRVHNLAIARQLLEASADVHQRVDRDHGASQFGDTILMETIWWYTLFKDPAAVALLLDFGANPNDRNEEPYEAYSEHHGGRDWQGYSALGFAAKRGLHEVVALLLERGADPALGRNDGRSAFDLAKENGHASTVALIKQYQSRPGRGLQRSRNDGALLAVWPR